MSQSRPLEIRELRKSFGSVTALRGVSFEIEAGEVFGYLGANGAGKTTTLRIVLNLVRKNSGEIRIFGKPASDASARQAIGFLPGDLHLYGDMTGIETLDFFARFRPGFSPALRASLAKAFDLDMATLRRRVKFLSHGTRQKVGLIAAMQHDPGLLLLDEPSNGLDPLVQLALLDIIRGFAARGCAVLMSSHILSDVEAVCRRVAIIRQGEIVASETIENLRQKVVRKMTLRFRGEAPMLTGLAGVSRVEMDGRHAVLWVRGDLNPVLRRLAQTEVEDMVFREPELEDIFLSYYENA